MIALLARIFIRETDPTARRGAYGRLCAVVGICLNIVLFALKYFAGAISGSIAITADAFNNLSDAGSSVITLVGFVLAGKKPDHDHPFGHGRIEYIAGLAVSAIILVMGAELLRSSVVKIFSPEPVDSGLLPGIILLISIAVKLYMAFYNRAVGKKIDSAAVTATAADSLSDAVATTVVLASMLVSHFCGVNIDAYAGVVVALFILYTGVSSARDTVSPLLGQPPEPEFVEKVQSIVLAHPEVEGLHDLVVHDYGPGRVMISLHAEVDGRGDIFMLHDAIDNIERELHEKLGCSAVVHMDPVDISSPETKKMHEEAAKIVRELSPDITIHDFRMIPGPTHTNLVFDAVVPYSVDLTDAEAQKRISELVSERIPGCYVIVNIDRAYVR